MPRRAEPDLDDRLAAVVDAARRDLAAGRPLDLAARLAELERLAAGGGATTVGAVAARTSLDRLAALARARERLLNPVRFGPPAGAAAPSTAAAAPTPSVRDALLTARVTVSGTLLVEKRVAAGAGAGAPVELTLTWKLPPAAQQIVVQVEERPDPRSDYRPLAQHELGAATSWSLGLGDVPTRLLLRVEGRGGKVLQRARIAGLTAANAASKWHRQATAA